MKEYLQPLWIFVIGQAAILIIGAIAFNAIGDAATQLASDTASVAADFWGWSWVVGAAKLLYYIALELALLYFVAKSFLGLKSG